eukprot:gene23513-28519_t
MVWARSAGLAGSDQGWSVAMDPSGSFVYTTGGVSGAIHGESFSGDIDLFVMKFSTDGNWQWTRLAGTSGRDEGFGVAVDNSGSVYAAGTASGTLHSQASAGGREVLLIKFDSNGNRLWTRLTGTGGNDEARAIALDSTGIVYVTGYTTGGLNGNSFQGVWDMFLIKYAADGTRLWTRQFGSWDQDQGRGLAVDPSNNNAIYVTGFIRSAGIDGQTNAGANDLMLVKYNGDGTRLWTRLVGTSGDDEGFSVAVDLTGSVFVTGMVAGSVHGQNFAGGRDVILIKYSGDGTRLWTSLTGTSTFDAGRAVAVNNAGDIFVSGTYNNYVSMPFIKYATDGTREFLSLLGASGTQEGYGIVARSNDVYIAGFTAGANDFGVQNAGNYDTILIRASLSGMAWTRMAGGTDEDSARGIAVDNTGSVYVTGFVSGSIHGQSFAGVWDLVLTKYSSGGSLEWTRLVGGGGYDAGNAVTLDVQRNAVYVTGYLSSPLHGQTYAGGTSLDDEGKGVAVDSSGAVYVVGDARGALHGQTFSGGVDALIIKFSNTGTSIWTRMVGTSGADGALELGCGHV